jgi:prophage maintenance system killer protein
MNGLALKADELDAVSTIQQLDAGELSEDQLADWIATNSAKHRR